jgi:hypothetical protein
MHPRSNDMLFDGLARRLDEAQVADETDPGRDLRQTAEFLPMTMAGLQLSTPRSACAEPLRRLR